MWGLWEQVHSHSLDWPEGGALHPVRWGPAEAVVGREQSVNHMAVVLIPGVGLAAAPVHPRPPPHTHSTKLPMAAHGLQETYKSRLRFSALRTARITLESVKVDFSREGP